MKRQRGFSTLIIYAVLALAILGALGGIYYAGRNAGQDSKQAEWDQANRIAEDIARQLREHRQGIARDASKRLAKADAAASDYRAKWNAARARRPVLATCEPAQPVQPTDPVVVRADPADGGLRLRFTAEFVRLYDGAWTNAAGQPVFPDTRGSAAPAAAAVAVGPDELLRVHEENAARCSANARQLDRLIDLIRKLQAAT